jgi:hypothetical protein
MTAVGNEGKNCDRDRSRARRKKEKGKGNKYLPDSLNVYNDCIHYMYTTFITWYNLL